MKIYDYHTHSNFSEDCNIDMEDMIKGAITKNITELCFTEHHDIDYPEENFNFLLNDEKYFIKFNELKEKYNNKISLKLGLEIGLQSHIIDECKMFTHNKDYDFIIASQHCVENVDLYTKKFFKGKTVDEIYTKYFEEMYYNITHYNNFNVIGHMDLLRRYSKEVADYDITHSEEIIKMILNHLIKNNKGIEVNAGGLFYPLKSINPSIEILKIYKELGGEIITYGSDAHFPDRLGAHYFEVMRILNELEFKYITKFNKQKPEFIKIEI
ncbi:histidinol-phosphatase (PHP family) [Hypnocyclicus thermotrophus]|uniref:Histidinol-phosphatase n=1 Tax=Hypnocyclicus thermotrophus TaxID=1627895 RepID=A0AA46DZ21_9FUSO|nr:histidinol-phosphatase HisJ family protein [Hypnocyclicus thermotrophus]TDT71468.1 histidinol-phosphatase (PHP family) [Hypnocyclicus thermotrophus]